MAVKPLRATSEEKLDWEVEKLRNEVRNLGRTFIFAIATAFLALATTGYQIYDKVSSLKIQQYEKDKLQAEIDDLKKKRQDLATQQEIATSSFNQYQLELKDLASNSSLTDKQRIEQLQQISPSFQFSAPDTITETGLPARIYLQYLESQSARINALVVQLEAANYKVNKIAKSQSGRRSGASVAYYYPQDEDEAKRIIGLLKAMKIPNLDETPTKLKGAARPRHYDVWIAFSDEVK
jgi:hypothetical protein